MRVAMSGRPHPLDLVTLPYPGFATDLQPLMMVLLAQAEGSIAQALVALYRALGGGWEIRLNAAPVVPATTAPNAPATPPEPAPMPAEPVPLPQAGAVPNADPPPLLPNNPR